MSIATENTSEFPSTALPSLRKEYGKVLTATSQSGAAWFFFALMLASVLFLVFAGKFDALASVTPFLVGVPILLAITIYMTRGVNLLEPIDTRCSSKQLWWQTGILLVIIAFVSYRNIVFYFPDAFHIPLIYPLARWSIYFLGPKPVVPGQMISAPKPPGHLVAIPVLEVLLPLPLLLLLGASRRELGLGRGYFRWRTTLLWSIIPVTGIIAVTILGIDASLLMFMQHLGREILQSGFFTEFLFHGALMTRLSYLLRNDWGIVLCMLIFGLSTIGLQTNNMDGDWLVGIATMILNQSLVGLCLAVILQRTGNLVASSIAYTLFETFIAFT